ncbi:hypothetical protein L9F63_019051, partial [Diploptera punctata]
APQQRTSLFISYNQICSKCLRRKWDFILKELCNMCIFFVSVPLLVIAITTLAITTLAITTLAITTLAITTLDGYHNTGYHNTGLQFIGLDYRFIYPALAFSPVYKISELKIYIQHKVFGIFISGLLVLATGCTKNFAKCIPNLNQSQNIEKVSQQIQCFIRLCFLTFLMSP